jgi:hypothetical protein
MGVAVDASANEGDAETEHLPGVEGPVVVPLEGVGLVVQVTGGGGDVVYGTDGRRRWLLTWNHQLLRWTHGWCSRMDQGEGVFPKAPWCTRSLGERQRHSARSVQSMYGGNSW